MKQPKVKIKPNDCCPGSVASITIPTTEHIKSNTHLVIINIDSILSSLFICLISLYIQFIYMQVLFLIKLLYNDYKLNTVA